MQERHRVLVDAPDKVCRRSDHTVLPVHQVQPHVAQLCLMASAGYYIIIESRPGFLPLSAAGKLVTVKTFKTGLQTIFVWTRSVRQ
jgi:hypothetical protein